MRQPLVRMRGAVRGLCATSTRLVRRTLTEWRRRKGCWQREPIRRRIVRWGLVGVGLSYGVGLLAVGVSHGRQGAAEAVVSVFPLGASAALYYALATAVTMEPTAARARNRGWTPVWRRSTDRAQALAKITVDATLFVAVWVLAAVYVAVATTTGLDLVRIPGRAAPAPRRQRCRAAVEPAGRAERRQQGAGAQAVAHRSGDLVGVALFGSVGAAWWHRTTRAVNAASSPGPGARDSPWPGCDAVTGEGTSSGHPPSRTRRRPGPGAAGWGPSITTPGVTNIFRPQLVMRGIRSWRRARRCRSGRRRRRACRRRR